VATPEEKPLALDKNTVSVRPAEAVHGNWAVHVPPGYGFNDLLDQTVWRHIELQMQAMARRPQKHDLIRLIGDTFDVVCSVEGVDRGYQLRPHHGRY
jgi:hypothetical protein